MTQIERPDSLLRNIGIARAAIPASLLILTACGSGNDAALSEKVAAAEAAADRAVEAQKAAEKAAATAARLTPVVEDAPEEVIEDDGASSSEEGPGTVNDDQ